MSSQPSLLAATRDIHRELDIYSRLITTHYLWDISGTNYCPQSLETRKSWYSRLVYTCIRDTQDLEKNLLPICPEWRRASQYSFSYRVLSLFLPSFPPRSTLLSCPLVEALNCTANVMWIIVCCAFVTSLLPVLVLVICNVHIPPISPTRFNVHSYPLWISVFLITQPNVAYSWRISLDQN